MKDLGAEHLAGGEGVQLFGLLNFYLEQEQRYQPREKGLTLMEATPEVNWRIGRTWGKVTFCFSSVESVPKATKLNLKLASLY